MQLVCRQILHFLHAVFHKSPLLFLCNMSDMEISISSESKLLLYFVLIP